MAATIPVKSYLQVVDGQYVDDEFKRAFERAVMRDEKVLMQKLAFLLAKDVISLDKKVERIMNKVELYRTLAAHATDSHDRQTYLECAEVLTQRVRIALSESTERVTPVHKIKGTGGE
jgi:ribonucleotide reductase alpha subunit